MKDIEGETETEKLSSSPAEITPKKMFLKQRSLTKRYGVRQRLDSPNHVVSSLFLWVDRRRAIGEEPLVPVQHAQKFILL